MSVVVPEEIISYYLETWICTDFLNLSSFHKSATLMTLRNPYPSNFVFVELAKVTSEACNQKTSIGTIFNSRGHVM